MSTKADLVCLVENKIASLYCKELYNRRIGKYWKDLYLQRVRMINLKYALDLDLDDDMLATYNNCSGFCLTITDE